MKNYPLSFNWLWRSSAILIGIFLCASCAAHTPQPVEATALPIYTDGLAPSWENWSWESDINFVATNVVHSGDAALAITHTSGYAGLSIRTDAPLVGNEYSALAFWVWGNGAPLSVYIQNSQGDAPSANYYFTTIEGAWTEIVIPLVVLGSPAEIARINWQSQHSDAQSVYYLDDIRLIPAPAPTPPTTEILLHVDVAAARKPISPYIYGMNEYGTHDDDAQLLDELRLTVRRWGGNATSRYNWQTDISNHASDWYFNNLKQSDATNLPDDSAVNRFIDTNRAGNAATLLVLPFSGYVSNGDENACGFRVSKYGMQQDTAAHHGRPDCGNGVRADGSLIWDNDPADTSIPIGADFVANWVSYLVQRYGRANDDGVRYGGVRFYNYGNEPDLWFETHRDIQRTGYTYDEIRDRTYLYGAAIKAADPSAALLGPTTHGWSYYWHSPYDGQRQDWAEPDDRNAHGGTPFVVWYLQQMRAYEEATGVRILDYLDLHYYPQADGVPFGTAGDAATQARRLRSTRSLWDPTYVDESWIKEAGPEAGVVSLIPRMRTWIAENYPGTKLAIGEYNWGGQEHINGALAQADVLGIFGREGVDLATLWQPPQLDQPGAFAFRIYRNYDNAHGEFGDVSVAATSNDQAIVSIYAAQRSQDQALTLVIINKSSTDQAVTLTVDNFTPGTLADGGNVEVYRYSAADLHNIVRGNNLAIANGTLATTMPANSITLLIIPQGIAQGE